MRLKIILKHIQSLAKAGKICAAVDWVRRMGYELAYAIRLVTVLRAA